MTLSNLYYVRYNDSSSHARRVVATSSVELLQWLAETAPLENFESMSITKQHSDVEVACK